MVRRICSSVFIGKMVTSATCLIALAIILAVPLPVPIRAGGTYSRATYVTEQALPAVILVYSRIDYFGTFFIPLSTGTEAYMVNGYIYTMGSGFFVNPNGYLVTNGHVVFCFKSKNFDEDLITKSYIVQDAVVSLLGKYQEQHGVTFTKTDVRIILDYNLKNGIVEELNRSAYVILGEVQGDVVETKSGIMAMVVDVDPFFGRNLSILRIGLSNTPSLLIGDSDDVKTGDIVYSFGYPGVVAFHQQPNAGTFLSPSAIQCEVSAKSRTLQDVSVIKYNASITYGNCGGPLLDEDGKVIGVNNVGSITELGLKAADFDFAVASNVLQDFLMENGIENIVCNSTLRFQKGLAYYYARMYSSAKEEFDAVTTLFPYQWRAKQLSQECQAAISSREKAESSITASVSSTTVMVRKEAVTVSGSIQHVSEIPVALNFSWPAAQILVQYSRPDGSVVNHTVLNSPEGTFVDTFTPDMSGQWSISVTWQGDDDHSGATTRVLTLAVTEPTVLEILTQAGIIYVIPAGVVLVVVAIILMRKKSKAGPFSPPLS